MGEVDGGGSIAVVMAVVVIEGTEEGGGDRIDRPKRTDHGSRACGEEASAEGDQVIGGFREA